MYLYEKQGGTINVYDFRAEHSDLVNYRMEQMKKIPAQRRVLFAESLTKSMEPLFQYYIENLDQIVFDYEEADDWTRYFDGGIDINGNNYHKLKVETFDKEKCKRLLQSYYQGELTGKEIARIQYETGIRYFLLKNRIYIPDPYNNQIRKLEGIIELPESLYLLHLLQQEKFSLISDQNISEQLRLFTMSYIDSINIEEMQKMDACGITDDISAKALIKAHNDANVLRLIKKQ